MIKEVVIGEEVVIAAHLSTRWEALPCELVGGGSAKKKFIREVPTESRKPRA